MLKMIASIGFLLAAVAFRLWRKDRPINVGKVSDAWRSSHGVQSGKGGKPW